MTALLLSVVAAIALGCQWLAWRIRLPAILFLLLAGLLAGPGLGLIDPDQLLGELLFPLVSLSVAIILFEGSLTLDLKEIRQQQRVVLKLVSIGALVTWAVIAVSCQWLFEPGWALSILFGALTVVTGPTVIAPMLKAIRPKSELGNILRWEGIVIDPVGALLVVVVYEFIVAHGQSSGIGNSLLAFVEIIAVGTVLGLLAGWLLGKVLARQWLPEYLQNLGTLASVMLVFSASNTLVHESGLLAVTLMGAWLANRRDIHIAEILNFKEELSLVLISGLFILLAARLNPEDILSLGWAPLALLALVQFVARPLSVWVSTLGSSLSIKDKLFLGWVAPRGIVAAAVSALFAIKLEQAGEPAARLLVPLTFCIIFGTVIFQSLSARVWARWLGVVEPARNGFLILGANKVGQAIAEILQKQQVPVLLADSNYELIQRARLAGLRTFFGNPLSDYAANRMDLSGIGKLLAVSPDQSINALACSHFREEFGEQKVFLLPTEAEKYLSEKHRAGAPLRGHALLAEELSWSELAYYLSCGYEFKSTRLSEEYSYSTFRETQPTAIPMMSISERGQVILRISAEDFNPAPGCRLISLSKPES
ncbi:cation:proton antiporter [Oceanobacter mangrovi]|uniref:cation:proton antiporter n=1 Tax=Oceanobacter mangrovi TaxID=2862510 RepID=UPI001C8E7108|nr:sodium:proton antiporter [Oceanobacter mangrovi]